MNPVMCSMDRWPNKAMISNINSYLWKIWSCRGMHAFHNSLIIVPYIITFCVEHNHKSLFDIWVGSTTKTNSCTYGCTSTWINIPTFWWPYQGTSCPYYCLSVHTNMSTMIICVELINWYCHYIYVSSWSIKSFKHV